MDNITDMIADIIDYLELFEIKTPERDNAIARLKEALFWLTYNEDL